MKTEGNDPISPCTPNLSDEEIQKRLEFIGNGGIIGDFSHVGGVGNNSVQFIGLTKLEYFAAMALQGLLANPYNKTLSEETVKSFSDISVEVAKSLIKSLNEEACGRIHQRSALPWATSAQTYL